MSRTIQWLKRIGMVTAALIGMVIGLIALENSSVSAGTEYSFQDTPSPGQVPWEGKPYISGHHVVWTKSDGQGYLQVYYMNLTSGEKKQVTSFASQKHSPRVSEAKNGKVYIIWTDGREYDATQLWVMHGYELATGIEWKLNADVTRYLKMSMDGSDFVGYDNYSLNMVHYDLLSNRETVLGKGRSPVVANGKVLYIHEKDGGLSMKTLATGETRLILPLPYHLNVTEIAFNGSTAFYKHTDLDLNMKYVVLDTSNPGAQPIDLTPAVKPQDDYYQMYIGTDQVSWIQDNGSGTPILNSYHLGHRESFKIAEGQSAFQAIGFDKGSLVTKGADGAIVIRTVVRTVVPDSRPETYGPVSLPVDTAKKKVGPQGGDLITKDGSVKLLVPAGAVSQATEMELKLHEKRTEALASAATGRLRPASEAWDIATGGSLVKPAQLILVYEKEKWSQLQTQKMAVYRWDELSQEWVLLQGRLDEAGAAVTANIAGSGIYALFVNDVEFADAATHWARDQIEVLASRGIVDGFNPSEFRPDTVLTRAQFTKMLLGALQIQSSTNTATSFTDVPADHWSAGWVQAAVSAGLVQGDGARFNPDAELTREQMMVMLVRAMGDEKHASALSDAEVAQGLKYADAHDVSSWARAYAALSTQSGLIEGDNGALHPKQSSTRAQAATVVYRLLKKLQAI